MPAYITYLTGSSATNIGTNQNKLKVIYKSLGFVTGFSLMFIAMGASIGSLGKIIKDNHDIIRKAGGILIVIFGLHTMGIFKIKLFYYEKRFLPFERMQGSLGSLLMGIAFASGWTPCIGPILSSILILAGTTGTLYKGIILLTAYSLGLSIPFILTAVLINNNAGGIKKLSRYLPFISAVSGVVMILMGVMVYTNKVNILSRYLNFFNF